MTRVTYLGNGTTKTFLRPVPPAGPQVFINGAPSAGIQSSDSTSVTFFTAPPVGTIVSVDEDLQGAGGGSTAFNTLTDKTTVDIVAVNVPLQVALSPFQYGSTKYLTAIDADVIPAGVLALNASGFSAVGTGDAQWRRVDSQPAHAGKRRSADRYLSTGAIDASNGGWWELSEDAPTPPMIGCPTDGVTDSWAALTDYLAMVLLKGQKGRLGSYTYCLSDELILNGYKIVLEGDAERTTLKGMAALNSSVSLKGIIRLRDAAACSLSGINFDSVVTSASCPDAIVLENTGAAIPGTTATMSRNKFRNIYVGRNKTGLNFNSAIRIIDGREVPDNNAENEFQGIHIEGIRRSGIEIASFNSLDNLIDDLFIMNPTGATNCAGIRTTSRVNASSVQVGGGGFVLGKHYINVHGGIGTGTTNADNCWKFYLEGRFAHDLSIAGGNGEDNAGYMWLNANHASDVTQVTVKLNDFNRGGVTATDYIKLASASQKIDVVAYGSNSNQGRAGGNLNIGANCSFTQIGGAISCASVSGAGQLTLNSSKQTAGTITVAATSPRPITNGHVGKITKDGATISLANVANNWPLAGESYGTRMRRLARVANAGNHMTALPLMIPVAWATGVAKLAGNVVSNGGNWYVACNSATTGATAPVFVDGDAHFDGASSTGVLWAYLGAAAISANDAQAPAVTFNTTSVSATFPNVYLPSANPTAYQVNGGYTIPLRTNYWELKAFDQAAGVSACRGASVSSVVTAASFAIFIPSNSGAVRVIVDGRYLSPEGFNPGASDSFLTVDFSSAGGRKARTVTVETNKSISYFGAIRVKAIDTVEAAVSSDPIKAAWISDSLFAGSSYGPFAAGGTAAQRAGARLGWADNRVAASGGTGYVNPGASLYTYGQRITEMLTWNPDVWCFMGSTNDIGQTGVQAAILAALQAVRAGGSQAPIFVFGVWPLNNAGVSTTEALVSAAVTQFADPLGQTFFIPLYGAAPLPIVTGAWNNTANTASVNATLYISGDNTHPIDIGTDMLGTVLAKGVRSSLPLVL